jgi:hypothetical protein
MYSKISARASARGDIKLQEQQQQLSDAFDQLRVPLVTV